MEDAVAEADMQVLVSDTDLAKILIHLPNDTIIKQVSEKMKCAFELRQASKRELESIDLTAYCSDASLPAEFS